MFVCVCGEQRSKASLKDLLSKSGRKLPLPLYRVDLSSVCSSSAVRAHCPVRAVSSVPPTAELMSTGEAAPL
ncbi:hypothetical protein C0Q70_11111 [Pomacea canaliculata]|uniref:Uncharacterized protein n=1 Tax=Pomacea canaliculata TaxID=400727 RepID=A0A2T7P554_POMCA|nr:hypothetical protein C0Q70_11111 [Pomacea canaliculata]